jgi:hypothetical protein
MEIAYEADVQYFSLLLFKFYLFIFQTYAMKNIKKITIKTNKSCFLWNMSIKF